MYQMYSRYGYNFDVQQIQIRLILRRAILREYRKTRWVVVMRTEYKKVAMST